MWLVNKHLKEPLSNCSDMLTVKCVVKLDTSSEILEQLSVQFCKMWPLFLVFKSRKTSVQHLKQDVCGTSADRLSDAHCV